MSRRHDLTDKVFGRLTVVCYSHTEYKEPGETKNCHAFWYCKCSCGNYTVARAASLTHNNTKSCGCIRKETSRRRMLQWYADKKGRLEK